MRLGNPRPTGGGQLRDVKEKGKKQGKSVLFLHFFVMEIQADKYEDCSGNKPWCDGFVENKRRCKYGCCWIQIDIVGGSDYSEFLYANRPEAIATERCY